MAVDRRNARPTAGMSSSAEPNVTHFPKNVTHFPNENSGRAAGPRRGEKMTHPKVKKFLCGSSRSSPRSILAAWGRASWSSSTKVQDLRPTNHLLGITNLGKRITISGKRVTVSGKRVTNSGNWVTNCGNWVTNCGNKVTICRNATTPRGNTLTPCSKRF